MHTQRSDRPGSSMAPGLPTDCPMALGARCTRLKVQGGSPVPHVQSGPCRTTGDQGCRLEKQREDREQPPSLPPRATKAAGGPTGQTQPRSKDGGHCKITGPGWL